MPRQPKIRFPAYRRFDEARIEANNAMVGLLVGTRLASHSLAAHSGSQVLLPQIYPAVRGIDMLNRTVEDTQTLLIRAERHLAYMAIPFVQAVFEDLVDNAVALLIEDGGDPVGGDVRSLRVRLDHIAAVTGCPYEPVYLEIMDFLRAIRNAIIHDGAVLTPRLVRDWSNLSQLAQAEWAALAQRPFDLSGDESGRLVTDAPELVVSLAVTNRMARVLNVQLGSAITSETWAKLAVADFEVAHPQGLRDRPTLQKQLAGFVRLNYGPAALPPQTLAAALAAARGK